MGDAVEPARVECHSGGAYADRPTALHWEGRRLEIVEIMLRWRTPQGPAFRVRVQDDQIFVLAYDEASDGWQIQPV